MKRILVIACVLSTGFLLCIIIFRITTKKPLQGQASEQQLQQAIRTADSFSLVKTRPLSLNDFERVVQQRGTNLNNLSETERDKLFACVNRFYECYSSGRYDDFKKFRMLPPFTVSEALVSAVKKIVSEKGGHLGSDDDILRLAWNTYNGSNKIGQVSDESIVMSVIKRQDLGAALRQPSVGAFPGSGASCWEGSVVYQPTPTELLKRDGTLRFFTLQAFVRFEPLVDGPATPLVLIGYWDPTREDWMPYALCTLLRVGNYDTMF